MIMINTAIKRLSTLMLILACCLSFSDAYAELIAEPLAAIPVGPSGENLQGTVDAPVIERRESQLPRSVVSDASLATNQLALDLINQKVDAQNLLITLGLSIVGILLGVIGLLFPLVSYFMNIKPAQEVLKQAQETMNAMDEKFAGLLASHRSREIDGAIRSLQCSDGFDILNSFTTLQLALFAQQASDSQVSEIVHLARKLEGEEAQVVQPVLIQLLAAYKTAPVSTFFCDLSSDTDSLKEHLQAIGRYLELSDDDEVWSRLKQQFKADAHPEQMISKLADVSRKQKKGSEKRYVNDEELVKSLSAGVRNNLYSTLKGSDFDQEILLSSLLHQSL